jgi:hypothetical protein
MVGCDLVTRGEMVMAAADLETAGKSPNDNT